ncbi:MAG: hypothetical protein AAF772_13830, partial [Acidobacteriota bacterium]
FVLAVDGVDRRPPPTLWRRLLLTEPHVRGVAGEALDAVLRTLTTAGCPVTVVDRPSGAVLAQPRADGLSALAA